MLRRSLLSFLLISTIACSSSNSESTPTDDATTDDTSAEDTGGADDTGAADSGATDTGKDSTVTDTGKPDGASGDGTADTAEVSTVCSKAGDVETADCGKCGTKARLCGSDLMWLPFGACGGEKGVCAPGDTRMTDCGKCGKRTETCNTTCAWDPGACTGEGVCNAGDTETQYGACTTASQVKIRTCGTTCTWSDWGACMAPKDWNDMAVAPITGRQYHSAVWTGTEMIVWGGQSSGSSYAADGAAYNPTTDTWRVLETAPIAGRYYHTAVWTGSKMIVWGGYGSLPTYKNDGAMYDPSTKMWTAIPAPTTPTIPGRYLQTAVWTGTEMIVWGGYGSGTCTGTYCSDGYAFNPSTSTWRAIKASPLPGRYYHGAVWTGTRMVVFGGYGSSCTSSYCGDAAAYDPTADSWTTLTPPSTDLDPRYEHAFTAGPTNSATFWGGYGSYVSSSYYRNTGAYYDASADKWTSIVAPSETDLPSSKRYLPLIWWGAGKFWVWGGYGSGALGNGASYDPTTSTWKAMPSTNAPTARYYATVVWDGTEAIVWGGYSYKNDGKIYRP